MGARDGGWVEWFLLGLPALCLVVVALRFGGGFTGFGSLAGAGLLVAAVLLVVCVLGSRGGAVRGAAGRSVAVRGHAHGAGAGLRARVALHEAGHAVAARVLGGRVHRATVARSGDSGIVRVRIPGDATSVVTFLLAGQTALGSPEGASADHAAIRKELRTLPRAQRREVRLDAEAAARRIVRRHAAEITRAAARLDQRGRL